MTISVKLVASGIGSPHTCSRSSSCRLPTGRASAPLHLCSSSDSNWSLLTWVLGPFAAVSVHSETATKTLWCAFCGVLLALFSGWAALQVGV